MFRALTRPLFNPVAIRHFSTPSSSLPEIRSETSPREVFKDWYTSIQKKTFTSNNYQYFLNLNENNETKLRFLEMTQVGKSSNTLNALLLRLEVRRAAIPS